jgi:hypothetical protein
MKIKMPKAPKAPAPRRRRVVTTEEIASPELIETDESDIELPDMGQLEIEEKLGVFHARFGEKDYKVRVELFNKEDNEFEIVDTVKLDGFDPFSSLKKYGGGRYRLSLLDEGGKYVAGGRMEVRIAKVAADLAAPAPAQDNGMALVLASLQSQNAQNLELLKAMIGRPLPPESKGPSLTELIAAMSGLRNLTPKEDGGMGGIKGTLELMKLVKEILPEPAVEDKSGVMGEVAQAVELFGKLGPMIAARRQVQGPRPATSPAVAPEVPPNYAAGSVIVNPEAAPEQESPMKPVIDKVQSYIPQLLAWAQRGKDVEAVAEFVLDEVDNEIVPLIVRHYRPGGITLNNDLVFEQLLAKTQDPAQIAAIFTVAPALVPYREWFERVIAKAYEYATTQDGDDASVEHPKENHNAEPS